MPVYSDILNRRKDMTEWLLHFTKDTSIKSAREVLYSILAEGALRPGFAFRGREPRPTIYGLMPAVCFSEQPLGAYVQYLLARRDTLQMGYGVLIHKRDVYVAGGLPVIYGLHEPEELQSGEENYDSQYRLLRPSSLPLGQQYRYVAFAPTRDPDPLDWTHEREWRWPSAAAHGGSEGFFYLCGSYANSNSGSYRGAGLFKGRVHVFVDYEDDIPWLQEKIQTAFQRGEIGNIRSRWNEDYSISWREDIKRVQVISLDVLRADRDGEMSGRFDDWPEEHKHHLVAFA